MQEDTNTLVEPMFSSTAFCEYWEHLPEYNAYSIDNKVHLEVAIPGIRRENLLVELNKGMLTVKGEWRPKPVKYSVQNIRSNVELKLDLEGSFEFDGDMIRVENGILFIDLIKH